MMPLLLADLSAPTPPPEALTSWLSVFFYLIGGITAVVMLVRAVTGRGVSTTLRDQPVEVKEHAGIATQQQLQTVKTETHGRIKREREEIDARIQRVEESTERRFDKINEKIDENTKLTSSLDGQLQQINQGVSQLTTTVTNFMRDQARDASR